MKEFNKVKVCVGLIILPSLKVCSNKLNEAEINKRRTQLREIEIIVTSKFRNFPLYCLSF